jgi:hypothetical protein
MNESFQKVHMWSVVILRGVGASNNRPHRELNGLRVCANGHDNAPETPARPLLLHVIVHV